MEKKKIDIKTVASSAGKTTKDILGKTKEKAITIIDQNDDGKFDGSDIAQIVNVVGDVAKKTVSSLKDVADETARDVEMRSLKPIFESDIYDNDFVLSKMIRVCDKDKKHTNSPLCDGSIGHITDTKDMKIINIYCDSIDLFNITLCPDNTYEFYYVDPRDCDKYIAIDDYFNHLRVARISELQRLAQDLGAKSFQVTYKEEKTSFTAKNKKGHVKIANNINGEAGKSVTNKEYMTAEIAAKMEFPGHKPIKPKLNYLSQDASVQNLIEMRMNESSPLTHQTLSIKLSNSLGIKENDALKIDGYLKNIKCNGNTTVTSEVQKEARRYLEYEIYF